MSVNEIPGWSFSGSDIAEAKEKYNRPGGTAGKSLAGGLVLREVVEERSTPPHRFLEADCAGRSHQPAGFSVVDCAGRRVSNPCLPWIRRGRLSMFSMSCGAF
jgi:hypothetical protein